MIPLMIKSINDFESEESFRPGLKLIDPLYISKKRTLKEKI
jgi:hypothetical protein